MDNQPPAKPPIHPSNKPLKARKSILKRQQDKTVDRLVNGDRWYVNHKRVVSVATEMQGNSNVRVVYHGDGAKTLLRPTDHVWCNRAPTLAPGVPSPLPVFDIRGLPSGAVQDGSGVGFHKDGNGRTSFSRVLSAGAFVGASHTPDPAPTPFTMSSTGTHAPVLGDRTPARTILPELINPTVRKQLRFATPSATCMSDVVSGPTTMATTVDHTPQAVAFTPALELPNDGGDFIVLQDGSFRTELAEVPEELTPQDSITLLDTVDYRSLPKDDILKLLVAASYWEPTTDVLKEQFQLWWSAHSFQLGNPGKLPRALAVAYRDAQTRLAENCFIEDDTDQGDVDMHDACEHQGTQPGGDISTPVGVPLAARAPEAVTPGHQSIAPPAGLYDNPEIVMTPVLKVVTMPLDSAGASSYPACFANYQPLDPANVQELRERWQRALKEAGKRRGKPASRNSIKEPLRFVDGLLNAARDILSDVEISPVFRAALDPYEEMAATLAMRALDTTLLAKIRKDLPAVPTSASLKQAIDNELSAQLNIDDYYSNVTASRFTVSYNGGDGKFATFEKEFSRQWDRYELKMAYIDPNMALAQKLNTFVTALPWNLQGRVRRQLQSQYQGLGMPATWAELLTLVRELDTLLKQDRDNARAVLGPSTGQGGRGRGGEGRRTFGRGRGRGRGRGKGGDSRRSFGSKDRKDGDGAFGSGERGGKNAKNDKKKYHKFGKGGRGGKASKPE